MSKQEKAVQLFNEGLNCSQAVVSVFSEELGLDEKIARKLSSGFSAGMRCGDMCGAVTGALMALGLNEGQVEAHDQATKMAMYARVAQIHDEFIARHGSNRCNELLGTEKRLLDGTITKLNNSPDFSKCGLFVSDAVTILDDLLNTKGV